MQSVLYTHLSSSILNDAWAAGKLCGPQNCTHTPRNQKREIGAKIGGGMDGWMEATSSYVGPDPSKTAAGRNCGSD